MSTAVGVALLTVTLAAAGGAGWDAALPRPVIEAGLNKAKCTVPASEARVLGSEFLSSRLLIVEVACWQSDANAGSILFAVPVGRPQDAQLVSVDRWEDGKVQGGFSISSPGFDAKTRTLSSTHKVSDAGDCGTIQEMKWTGWHFRLLHVWSKDRCDGELFEWDGRYRWQVFPQRGLEPDPEGSATPDETTYAAR